MARECTFPAGKKLFFPLVNRWYALQHMYITDEFPIEYWTGRANLFFDDGRANTCGLTLRIDGHDLLPDLGTMDEELYVRLGDEPFEIEVLDDNFASQFGLPAGPRTTWADGHYAMLRPLPPGDYTLEFGGQICDGDAITFRDLGDVYAARRGVNAARYDRGESQVVAARGSMPAEGVSPQAGRRTLDADGHLDRCHTHPATPGAHRAH